MDKKKINGEMFTDYGTVDVKKIEHQITYPGQSVFNLRNVSFAPGENNYLDAYGEDNHLDNEQR
ncbi:hypothetical protein [Aquibacillus sediminis]|uniref:hypothetical protein n=1 Tax=Aquibacillus sediminis TaxID=2574734 RepID=UPI0011089179|nr:hypothetical protein [Aquibacillus sediminis]